MRDPKHCTIAIDWKRSRRINNLLMWKAGTHQTWTSRS